MQAGIAVGNLASAIGIRTEDAVLVADLKAGSEDAFDAKFFSLTSYKLFYPPNLLRRSLLNPGA